jgi:nucleoside-diphosphate-sugar epimerase
MRILLTGSSGWLGRFLAPMLRARGDGVVGLDVAPGVDTQVLGSVADRALVGRVFAEHGIEAVIHAGALHKPDIVRYPAQAFIDVNVTGTLHLLEAAAAAGHDRFVMTSTTSLMISTAIRNELADHAWWLERPARAAQHLRRHQACRRAALPARASRKGAQLRRAAHQPLLPRERRYASRAFGREHEG